MWCNQIFSLLEAQDNDYIVRDIIVCDNIVKAAHIAKIHYGETAITKDTTFYPLEIGYTYNLQQDKFYNFNGEVVPKNPTEAEDIKKLNILVAQQDVLIKLLKEQNAALEDTIDDLLTNIIPEVSGE